MLIRKTIWAACPCVAICLIAAGGCEMIESKGDQVRPPGPSPADGAAASELGGSWWPFIPERAKWHAFTAFRMDPEKGLFIDAHVELLDQTGASVRGVGVMRFELYRQQGVASEVSGDAEPIGQWRVDLETLEANARYYDAIMRAYRFPLRVDAPVESGEAVRLEMQFVDHLGRRMTDGMRVTYEAEAGE